MRKIYKKYQENEKRMMKNENIDLDIDMDEKSCRKKLFCDKKRKKTEKLIKKEL